MNARKFPIKGMQIFYETCRRMGSDKTSTFYHNGKPRRGASHRAYYWNGRSGVAIKPDSKNTFAYAAWAAGHDDLEEFGPVEGSEYPLRAA